MNEQQRKAMDLAVEALEEYAHAFGANDLSIKAMYVAREALAQDALQALHDENKSLGLYEKGYADAMNWKVQNHLEHLPAAQPEQEPVAYIEHHKGGDNLEWDDPGGKRTPLYTTPPQPKETEQEPVAWMIEYEACAGGMNRGSSLKRFDYVWHKCSFVSEDKDAEIDATKWRNRKETPLYTTPYVATPLPQRTWVGLTDEQINQIADEFIVDYRIPAGSQYDFVRAIEAAHGIKEKNT